MYGRWVPGMSEGLHCSQRALDRTAPMAGNSRNTAISPHPKPIWPGTRHTVWKTGAWDVWVPPL